MTNIGDPLALKAPGSLGNMGRPTAVLEHLLRTQRLAFEAAVIYYNEHRHQFSPADVDVLARRYVNVPGRKFTEWANEVATEAITAECAANTARRVA